MNQMIDLVHTRQRQLVVAGLLVVRGSTWRYCAFLAHLSGPDQQPRGGLGFGCASRRLEERPQKPRRC